MPGVGCFTVLSHKLGHEEVTERNGELPWPQALPRTYFCAISRN